MALPGFLQNKKVLIGIVVVLVLAGGGIAAFLFLGGEQPGETPEATARVAIAPPPKPADTKPAETSPGGAPAASTAAAPAGTSTAAAVSAKPGEKPAQAPVTAAKPEAKPEAAAVKPAEKPAQAKPTTAAKPAAKPAAKKAASAKHTSKRWAVNTASFRTKAEATEMKKKLAKAGYRPYITEFRKDDINWFRLRVGFYATEAEARKAAENIARDYGLTGAWIAKPSADEVAKHFK